MKNTDQPSQTHEVAVIGVPFDANSSYLQGSAEAPPLIRDAFYCDSANLWTEGGIDLGSSSAWSFEGDLSVQDLADIETGVTEQLDAGKRVLSLGGDHAITWPIIRAYAKTYPKLNILHLDAHPDLYDELGGNRASHACPFARIMEEKLAIRLVQVGIRTLNVHQREQSQRLGTEIIDMAHIHSACDLSFDGPVYLSLDLDCLDPAFAPGISHYEPGGMSTREVLTVIQTLKGQLVGSDIVEFNPKRDPQGITAMVAGKLLKEILGKMLERTPNGSDTK